MTQRVAGRPRVVLLLMILLLCRSGEVMLAQQQMRVIAFFSKTDLLVSHELTMNGSKRLRFELNVLNLFNQMTSRHRYNFLNRGAGLARDSSAIDLSTTDLSKGYDYRGMLSQTEDQTTGFGAYDPRYGLDDLFNTGFQGRFGIKFTF